MYHVDCCRQILAKSSQQRHKTAVFSDKCSVYAEGNEDNKMIFSGQKKNLIIMSKCVAPHIHQVRFGQRSQVDI